jgi:aspartate racemase
MHKKIGILGGLSPESTIGYYEYITRSYIARYGDCGYPEILIYSVNFQQYMNWQRQNCWVEAAQAMVNSLNALHRAGAEFGLISTNTMHIVFDDVQAKVDMPLISIVETAAQAVRAAKIGTVGVLGSVFTMQEGFYREGLKRAGIEMLVPKPEKHARINEIIFGELCRGVIRQESRQELEDIIEEMVQRGAGGVVLGCTEIPLMIKQENCKVPVFDTTALHAERALEYAISATKPKATRETHGTCSVCS